MNTENATNSFQLPLSWARTDTADPRLNPVNLPWTSAQWIPLAEIPHNISFEQLYQKQLRPITNGVVLQSVNVSLRDYLIQKGWQVAAMGTEAILDLPWRGKRSVREVARRGQRHGQVQEVENNQRNQTRLANLIRQSPSRQSVQLKYIERPCFDKSTRLFVFETAEQQWLGAVTLSRNSATAVHTELLIRHKKAPIGIMEALIAALAQQLLSEGITQLSLGCVPLLPTSKSNELFDQHRHPNELWHRRQLMFKLGQAFTFAYNSAGLWQFKNKFSPRWEPLYLAASTDISWLMIAEIIQATGYLKLIKSSLSTFWPSFPKTQQQQPTGESVKHHRTPY